MAIWISKEVKNLFACFMIKKHFFNRLSETTDNFSISLRLIIKSSVTKKSCIWNFFCTFKTLITPYYWCRERTFLLSLYIQPFWLCMKAKLTYFGTSIRFLLLIKKFLYFSSYFFSSLLNPLPLCIQGALTLNFAEKFWSMMWYIPTDIIFKNSLPKDRWLQHQPVTLVWYVSIDIISKCHFMSHSICIVFMVLSKSKNIFYKIFN